MKLGHSKEDCIVETDCKNWQSKPKNLSIIRLTSQLISLVNGIIDAINAEEVVSELVNGEIEFRLEDQQLVT